MFLENKALDQHLGANPKKHIFCFIFHQFSCFFLLIQLKALNMLKSRFWPEFGVCSTPMQWLSKYATQINFYKVRIKIKFTPSAVSVSSFGEISKNTMTLDLELFFVHFSLHFQTRHNFVPIRIGTSGKKSQNLHENLLYIFIKRKKKKRK